MFAGGGVRFHTAVVFSIHTAVVVVACVVFIHGFSRCRGFWILLRALEYFVVYLSCVYIGSAEYIGLPVLFYLLQCLLYHVLYKMGNSGIFMLRNIR